MAHEARSGSTNTSTLCYGAPGQACTTHRLSCPIPLVIQIINTSYGYRSECKDIQGLSACTNTTCCNEELGDCFQPFSCDNLQQVTGNCSGLNTCTINGFREVHGKECGGSVSAYSKIQYDCVTKDFYTTASMIDSSLLDNSTTDFMRYSTSHDFSTTASMIDSSLLGKYSFVFILTIYNLQHNVLM
ncbi:hypothetical protein LOTGIDRAFT_175606 [Lottia gigantea]|uniref:SUEL-type lectin domain-containing protein n=1 Tax=Lottia gigantea TaxID=225164 RepID=V4AIA8_LOTGI|nr:hypothetical protein LOTGIDRAFT_175606 [Lottia gigantea]ESO93171.1 hypothetical protein LOTGIDRAFT_175606 [Lottia gigantea]